MDQINPLSELAHKRRLSSMGPGGLSRERAGFEVRDAHATHYGRICAVETPEGANIGLVLNLANFARVNEYGFIETPYRKVVKGKVTDEVVYLDAYEEEQAIIAGGGVELDAKGGFKNDRVSARSRLRSAEVDSDEVTHIDASRNQIIGSSAGLIPFIEKNYVYRSLMGSNQQRQAVPLIQPQSPIVGTGLEIAAAHNTGQVIVAEDSGEVVRASAQEVVVK